MGTYCKLDKEVDLRPDLGIGIIFLAKLSYSLFPFVLFFNCKFYIERQPCSCDSLVTCLHINSIIYKGNI